MASKVGPMSVAHRELLRQYRKQLIETLDVPYIMPHMIAKGIMTGKMNDTIMCNRERILQVGFPQVPPNSLCNTKPTTPHNPCMYCIKCLFPFVR